MQLNPGLSVTQVSEDVVQIGSGRRSIQLQGCSPAVLSFVERMRAGVADGTESAAARSAGLDPAHCRELLQELSPLLRWAPEDGPAGAGHSVDLLAQDIAVTQAAHALDHTAGKVPAVPTGAEVVRRRRRAAIQVAGLGRTGAAAASVLASAGIGRLVLCDPQPVGAGDLGTGYLSADVGRLRPIALARRLEGSALEPVVLPLTAPSGAAPAGDVTVLVCRGGLDVGFLALARSAEHPVLPVLVRDDDVLIGPWSTPGHPGCPLCWELTAGEWDEWRTRRTDALHRCGAGWEDTVVATAAAALAARAVTRFVDGAAVRDEAGRGEADCGEADCGEVTETPGDAGIMLRLDAVTGEAQSWTVPSHPGCGCSA